MYHKTGFKKLSFWVKFGVIIWDPDISVEDILYKFLKEIFENILWDRRQFLGYMRAIAGVFKKVSRIYYIVSCEILDKYLGHVREVSGRSF